MEMDWNIVDQMLSPVTFYMDRYDRYTVYAEYRKHKGCLEFYPIESKDFESCLRVWYSQATGCRSAPNVKAILQYIQDDSNYFEEFTAVEPYARIGGNLRDGIEYFLADRMRQVVRVSDQGWSVSGTSRFKFLSSRTFGEQVIPISSKSSLLDLLAPLVNLKDDNLVLFAIWLTQTFSCGSHYGIMLSAERGSGKSSLSRVIGRLIDPSRVETTIMQTKLEDLQTYLANHYLASFDNIREIPTDFSDTFCAAITGTTVAKRQLFKDRDEVQLMLHNVVVMNGIDIFPKESDLAERFLYFKLQKLKPTEAKSDYDLKQLFQKNRPLILGAIFDLLADASQIIKGLEPKNPTRMVDAYQEMLAIAMAMGLSEKEFHRLITENIAQLVAVCQESVVVQAVKEYMLGPMAGKRKVIETSTKFYNHVSEHYAGDKSKLPCRAADFSKALKSECAALMKAGFGCLVDDTGADASVITIIRNKK